MLFPSETKHYLMTEPVQNPDASGKNIILIHHHVAPDVMAFLEKMISAFGWTQDQCYHQYIESGKNENYSLLWRSLDLKLVVSFGISPELLGIYTTPKPYQLINLDAFLLYQCDTLEKLANSKELKGMIWRDLKNLQFSGVGFIPVS
ncbi:MAG: hypothetical protein ABI761_04255 [Saprospiraceae bacterium]